MGIAGEKTPNPTLANHLINYAMTVVFYISIEPAKQLFTHVFPNFFKRT